MALKQSKRPSAPNIPTIIEFLLDETGSMSSCKRETVAGFNDFLSEQKNQPGSCSLTLTKFDTGGMKTPYIDLDVGMVPPMIEDWFLPNGGTNLNDTIGDRLASLSARLEKWTVKPNVLFVVMTDGDDNASRRFTEMNVKAALTSYMQHDGWTFVYLGSNAGAENTGKRLGFPPGNVKSFANAEMRQTMQGLAKATTAYRATRSVVKATETDFFNSTQ